MILAGSLRHRITIWAHSTTVNEVGEQLSSWASSGSVWAARTSLKLVEVNRMAGLDHAAEAKFRIRWRADLSTANEIEHDGQRYSVVSIEEVGNREGLDLFVRAV